MRRCFISLLSAMFFGVIANAQLVNNGATITVQSGATIKCTGAIVNNSGGIIQNAGVVSSDGELRNEAGGTLTNNGTSGVYEATTKFINNGNAFTAIKLKLVGSANTDSIKTGVGSTYDSVILAKGAGNTATLSDAMTVNGGIRFDNDNNRLIIEDESLIMGSTANFASADDNEFVVTNNTGTVTKQGLVTTPFTYQVGFSATEYNPVTITNSGTANNIAVRCLQNVLSQGLTGTAVTTDFVNNSWVVSSGGAGYNLALSNATWTPGTDELSGFNRAKSGIARYNTGTDWDLMPASNVVAATASGSFYTRDRTNLQNVGVFAVADLDKVNAAKLALKVYLQGPGVTNVAGTNLMGDLLRDDPGTGPVDPVIPTTQPYSTALNPRFARVGIYDGSVGFNETVNPTVFNVTGNDAIVDWVYVSTLDATTPATKLQTRAALLQRDGDIVDLDGVSPLTMPIDNDANYHILVGHRNHLSIRTDVGKGLADGATFTYNFSSSQAQVFQQTGGSTAVTDSSMKFISSVGVFALWGGNASGNNVVRYSSPGNDPAAILASVGGLTTNSSLNVYSIFDVNMNRKVQYSTPGNDPAFILGQVLGSVTTIVVTEHL